MNQNNINNLREKDSLDLGFVIVLKQSFVFNSAINCEPPNLDVEGASHMVYTCPESYRFGAECMLSCKAGYPLGGVDKISCLNIDESTTPPILDWRWPKDALGPYCKGML